MILDLIRVDLRKPYCPRRAALEAKAEAVARVDTKAVGKTSKAVQRATTERLASEMGVRL